MDELTNEKIQRNTYYAERYYLSIKESINNYETDIKKDYRIKIQECKTCFYIKSGFAGQAFTKYICRNCGEEKYHPNTSVPVYCKECAERFDICQKCGAELN